MSPIVRVARLQLVGSGRMWSALRAGRFGDEVESTVSVGVGLRGFDWFGRCNGSWRARDWPYSSGTTVGLSTYLRIEAKFGEHSLK